MEDLKEIEKNLQKLEAALDRQFEAASTTSDLDKFHKNLIEILAQSPQEKEIIEFVVFINDRLETKHTITTEIMLETIKDVIKLKRQMVKKIIGLCDNTKKISLFERFLDFVSDNKGLLMIILISLGVVVFGLVVFLMPEQLIEILKEINKIGQ